MFKLSEIVLLAAPLPFSASGYSLLQKVDTSQQYRSVHFVSAFYVYIKSTCAIVA